MLSGKSIFDLASYMLVGLVFLLAMDYIAPPWGTGIYAASHLEVAVRDVGENQQPLVNRSQKRDFLVPVQQEDQSTRAPLAKSFGCDSAFSALAGYPAKNFVARCLAARETALKIASINSAW